MKCKIITCKNLLKYKSEPHKHLQGLQTNKIYILPIDIHLNIIIFQLKFNINIKENLSHRKYGFNKPKYLQIPKAQPPTKITQKLT